MPHELNPSRLAPPAVDQSGHASQTLDSADLQLVLALARTGTLAAAGRRMGVDQSTVFRALQKLEKRLGLVLFDRVRTGCRPTATAEQLAQHAEKIEAELEAARVTAGSADGPAQGLVRISTTDVLLNALVIPSLSVLVKTEPLLRFEISAGYQLANLSRRDADIALRVTTRPPGNMIGRSLGAVKEAVFGLKRNTGQTASSKLWTLPWVELDDSIADNPAFKWRRHAAPAASVVLHAPSIQTLFDCVVNGIGIAILPVFMTQGNKDFLRLSEDIPECEKQLWLLSHPDSRHLRRVSAVYRHMAETITLE